MVDLFRRNHDKDARTCKFCGMQGLKWTEVAPNKFRLAEPNGAVHDCRQFHENKQAAPQQPVDRGSTLRRLNNWMQRYSVELSNEANSAMEDIIDDLAKR